MITNKLISKFDKNGFIIIRNFIDKKNINNIFDQLNKTLNHILKKNDIKFNSEDTIEKKYIILKKKNPILKSHFYDSIKLLDATNRIVFSSKVINTMKKLLKKKVIFVRGQRLRLDHKSDPYNLPLHQELNNISNDFGLLWMPLVKVNQKSGSLCIIPRSHKFGHLLYTDSKLTAEKHRVGIVKNILKNKKELNYKNPIVDKLFKKENLYFPSLNPGDALIFKTFIFHGSTPYIGKGLRWTLLSSFHPIDTVPYIVDEKMKSFAIPYESDYNFNI